MKRCNRCVMPETVPGITFNEDGVCSYCVNYKKEKCLGKKELDKIIASVKKKDNVYDCIVPLSGGRDSTFVLYVARVIYNLKVLAVSYDNEFRVDQALVNMKNACERLNIDFVSIRSKKDIAHKIVKCGILSGFGLCRACTYGIKSVVYRAAEKYKVPLILWGESSGEDTLNMSKEARMATRRASRFLRLCKINFYKVEFCALLQKLEFPVRGNRLLSRSLPRLKNENIKEIRVFDYIPWDRKKIKETIMNELGWVKPHGHVSTWRTDCILHRFVNYRFFKWYTCSKDCFGYTNMINSGQMSREEALMQEEETVRNCTANMDELLEGKIGLSKKQANKILSFEQGARW